MRINSIQLGRNTPPISAQKSSARQSNIELLRIISMLLVMLVHSMEGSLGRPTSEDLVYSPVDVICRVNLETLGLVCVNVFVLISGWFGIKCTIKGAAKFIYQCLFMAFAVVAFLAVMHTDITWKDLVKDMASPKNWWFVYAYFTLYILSPILNMFIEQVSRKTFRNTLIVFFGFQTIYGFLYSLPYFAKGYSPLSFIGLYLLARYIHIYSPKITKFSCRACALGYVGVSVILSFIMCFLLWKLPWHGLLGMLFDWYVSYTSPLNIAASILLLLCFSKMKIQSSWINKIAASSFAVYLIHNHPAIHHGYFKPFVIWLHENYSLYSFFILLGIFLVVLFLLCCAVDRIRLFTYKKISLWLKV